MSEMEPHHATSPRLPPSSAMAWASPFSPVPPLPSCSRLRLETGEPQAAGREQVLRGKYLVTLGLCTDCHTPGYFFGKPDQARLSGRLRGWASMFLTLACFTGLI